MNTETELREAVERLAEEWATHTEDPRAWAAARLHTILAEHPAKPTEGMSESKTIAAHHARTTL